MSKRRLVSQVDVSLFHVCAQEYGDATCWLALAAANNITDPYFTDRVTIVIPDYDASFSGGAPQ